MTKRAPACCGTKNWKSDNEALKRRVSLRVGLERDRIRLAPGLCVRGVFSDAAVQFCLMVRLLFGLPLRQTNGRFASISKLTNLDWGYQTSRP